MPTPPLPLARHPAVSTASLEEARETFGRLAAPIEIEHLDRRAPFQWRSNRLSIGPVTVAAHQYGGAFRATAEHPPELFSMSFPLTAVGGEATFAGGVSSIARKRSTHVSSPSGRTSFHLRTGYRGLQLLVGRAEMLDALGALTGVAPKEALHFEPRLSLASGVGASLERLVTFAAHEADHEGGLLEAPLVAARLGETLLANLLLGHAHNYSERLARSARAAEPRYVRATAEYLEMNAAQPIRMTDLGAAVGFSVRALQLGFIKHRGCTPMEFLRERRLEIARARLLVGGGTASVSDVARECGFAHLGRFSASYHARFGELPSETRAKAR